MRIEPEQVRAVVKTLKMWGDLDTDYDPEDLIAEFDTRSRERPDENQQGGFRRGDPDTSKKAAFDALPRTGSQRRKALESVLHRHKHHLLSTYEDVESDTGISGVWKRLSELKQGGWIKAVGTRKGSSGSEIDAYTPTQKALNWRSQR